MSSQDPDRVDVAIVGVGVIGLSTAWALRRRGLTVAVIDPDPGRGASRAAAGMIAPASEVRFQQDALHPLMGAAAGEYPDFVRSVEQDGGEEVGYRATETLVCAADPADRQALADLCDYQLARGLAAQQLTSRAARALEPALSPRIAGAVLAPDDHQVDPRRLVRALLSALAAGPASRAAVIRERVAHVLTGPDGRVSGVVTDGGRRVGAGETVLAPGTGLDRIGGLPEAARLPVRPVHGDILRTRLPKGASRLIERTVRGVVGGRPVYLAPRADEEIVIGATEREDGNDHPSAGGVHRLLHDAQMLVPAVADLELHEVMARARPGSPDDLPFLGRIADEDGTPVPGLVLSTGYFRHGVLLAPLAARLTADLVTGAGPTRADLDHLRAVDPARVEAKGETPFADHVTPEVPA